MGLFKRAKWRTSTVCANGTCVQVAFLEDLVGLRDSKDRRGPVLVFSSSEWKAFVDGMRGGDFDRPGA
ncbi:MAG TPA: DUF397 domain-containing protein [Actinomycetota bacterium]|nr:DUF397 domain-containing protein [Actinomycetota bacterium]